LKKINYDPGLDILRGISILLVVLYHLDLNYSGRVLFKGGFIGVDIFFVISGYLITSILYINLKDDKFNFKEFYLKRFVRIFPVYILVIFITLIFSYFILLPNQLVELSRSSLFSISFFSNLFFWRYLNDYYNPDAILNPLLHTWSLAIEIQYYIIFTVLFFFIYKHLSKTKLYLSLILILSLIIANIFSFIEPQINFFGFQSRFWEFILGSFVFFYKKKIKINLDNISRNILYFLIIGCAFIFDQNSKHPSLLTLIFLAPVCLLMLNNNKISGKFIFDKTLIFFGLLSYSLYLWHYPILSFANRIIGNNQSIFEKLILFVISIFFSMISFYFLEKKLKKNTNLTIFFSSFLVLLSIFIIYKYQINDGYKNRLNFSNIYLDFIKQPKINYKSHTDYFEKDQKINILIIGNSHSVQTYNGFRLNKDHYNEFEFKNFHIQVACIKNDLLNQSRDFCKGITDASERKKFLVGKKNIIDSDIIILSTRWTEKDLKNLPATIDFFNKINKKIIIFNSILDIDKKKERINFKNLSYLKNNFLNKKFPYERYVYINNKHPLEEDKLNLSKEYYKNAFQNRVEINKKLKKLSTELNINFLDLNSYMCDDRLKLCKIVTDKKKHILNDTTGHLTLNGTKYLFKLYHSDINKSLEKLIYVN